jgi:hypothetical protein
MPALAQVFYVPEATRADPGTELPRGFGESFTVSGVEPAAQTIL